MVAMSSCILNILVDYSMWNITIAITCIFAYMILSGFLAG